MGEERGKRMIVLACRGRWREGRAPAAHSRDVDPVPSTPHPPPPLLPPPTHKRTRARALHMRIRAPMHMRMRARAHQPSPNRPRHGLHSAARRRCGCGLQPCRASTAHGCRVFGLRPCRVGYDRGSMQLPAVPPLPTNHPEVPLPPSSIPPHLYPTPPNLCRMDGAFAHCGAADRLSRRERSRSGAKETVATRCTVLQRAAPCCNALHRVATRCTVLQRVASRCNALRRVALLATRWTCCDRSGGGALALTSRPSQCGGLPRAETARRGCTRYAGRAT